MSWERKVQKKPSWSSSTQAPRESLFKTQGFSKPVEEPVEKTALKPIQFRGRDTSHLDHIKVNSDRPIVTPRVNLSNLQAKLTVGAPGDKYEQEADSMAQKVMSTPDSVVQRMTPGEEEEVRTKPLAANITPLVQREEIPEEKEEVQAKPLGNGTIQREEIPEEKEEVQAKLLGNGTIQREEMPEEKEEVQAKLLGNGTIQREEMPEEKEIQTKPLLQRSTDGSFQAGGNIESRLNSSKGGGSPLADNVQGFMEPRFGADFSQVRVHTDGDAVQMNLELGAQAFAHGSDIYFGAGKAAGNNELTAHELTHVVQQTGGGQTQASNVFDNQLRVQQKCEVCDEDDSKTLQKKDNYSDISSVSTDSLQRVTGAAEAIKVLMNCLSGALATVAIDEAIQIGSWAWKKWWKKQDVEFRQNWCKTVISALMGCVFGVAGGAIERMLYQETAETTVEAVLLFLAKKAKVAGRLGFSKQIGSFILKAGCTEDLKADVSSLRTI